MDKIKFEKKRRGKKMKLKLIMTSAIIFVVMFLFFSSAQENQVTKETALQAISYSEQIIQEMQENNLSVDYVNDSLIEARMVFEQANYASILRGEVNATEKEKQEASDALKLISWQNINYGDVLVYTSDIKQRKENAFLLLDKISVEDNNLNNSNNGLKTIGLFSSKQPVISNDTLNILLQAKVAFSEERYNDSEKLLLEFQNALEQERAQSSTLAVMKSNAMNFFQRYWIYILALFVVLVILGYFFYKKIERKLLKNKIKKMKAGKQVINSLMKKTQEERFNKNKISGLVYNIRMKKYEEKLQEIKEELPVLEKKFGEIKK
jgi:hypothetical protein